MYEMCFVSAEFVNFLLQHPPLAHVFFSGLISLVFVMIFFDNIRWWIVRKKQDNQVDTVSQNPTNEEVERFIQSLHDFYGFEKGKKDNDRILTYKLKQHETYKKILKAERVTPAVLYELESTMIRYGIPL